VADENPSGLGAFELPLRLPGQYFDKETNLSYNYFRDYDSAIGRYVQSDPIGLLAGLNTYSYVRNGPTQFVDSLGLFITTVDAYCTMRPVECGEILGDIVQNAGNLAGGCTADEAARVADDIRKLGVIGAVIGGIGAVKSLPNLGKGGKPLGSNAGDPSKRMTPDQEALKDIVNEATFGGRKALTKDQAQTVLDWAKETKYPGVRASPSDLASPSNWKANPVPHIHMDGVGRNTHVPVEAGFVPRP
jgi:RHS repeat-associated protein